MRKPMSCEEASALSVMLQEEAQAHLMHCLSKSPHGIFSTHKGSDIDPDAVAWAWCNGLAVIKAVWLPKQVREDTPKDDYTAKKSEMFAQWYGGTTDPDNNNIRLMSDPKDYILTEKYQITIRGSALLSMLGLP